jgi:hypothetical protein
MKYSLLILSVTLLINYTIVECSCPGGYKLVNPGVNSFCEKCPPGSYSPGGVSLECYDCPPGIKKIFTLNKIVILILLKISKKGTYCPTEATITPSNCSVGTEQPNFSATGLYQCKKCLPGTFSNRTGTAKCSICFPGTYCNKTGMINPIDCPKGTSNINDGQIKCEPCKEGYYANKTSSFILIIFKKK